MLLRDVVGETGAGVSGALCLLMKAWRRWRRSKRNPARVPLPLLVGFLFCFVGRLHAVEFVSWLLLVYVCWLSIFVGRWDVAGPLVLHR